MVVDINNDNFDKEVLKHEGVVIMDFYGTWCMPCKILAPIVDKVVEEQGIKLAKVDVDNNTELVKKFGIMSVPTLIIFKDGVEVAKSSGVVSESRILELIK
ncbi:MAG: thioredoxin [Clostridiales bacterium]|nr:thioredoxin [Clostridiales bacterium]